MGSLMAGWNSTVLDDEHRVRLMRNRSVTNEDVEAFWRRQHSRPKPAEDGEIIISSPAPLASSPVRVQKSTLGRLERMRSSSSACCSSDDPSSPTTRVDAADSPSTSRDWWTRSSWAFLNEAPHAGRREEGSDHFHVSWIVTGNA